MKIIKKSLLAFFIVILLCSQMTFAFDSIFFGTDYTSTTNKVKVEEIPKVSEVPKVETPTIPSVPIASEMPKQVENVTPIFPTEENNNIELPVENTEPIFDEPIEEVEEDIPIEEENILETELSGKGLPSFGRTSRSYLSIVKNCKSYYARNKFVYNKNCKSKYRSVPADKSIKYNGKYVTDCSTFVCWTLYEYAKANNKTQMAKYYNKQIVTSSFKGKHLTALKKGQSPKAGDILKYNGHVEIYAGSVKKGHPVVYNCGTTKSVQTSGTTVSSKTTSQVKAIYRVSN